MTEMLAAPHVIAQDLDPEVTDRLLAEAAQQRSVARVSCVRRGLTLTWPCTLAAQDDISLTLELDGAVVASRSVPTGAPLEVRVDTTDGPYVFETRCVDGPRMNIPMLRVVKPRSLVRADRRCARRRQLHQPTEVVLRGDDGDSRWRCHGTLLNVSQDGLACRLPSAASACLRVNQVARVAFSLGEGRPEFDLPARVVNMTEHGDGHRWIAGLAFTRGAKLAAAGERLRQALPGDALSHD